MMAEINKNIQFFNEKDELREPVSKQEESMIGPNCSNIEGPNMSFSFAVETPIEMVQQHNLIGQGWKNPAALLDPHNKREVKQKEKEIEENEQIAEKIKQLVSEVGQKVSNGPV